MLLRNGWKHNFCFTMHIHEHFVLSVMFPPYVAPQGNCNSRCPVHTCMVLVLEAHRHIPSLSLNEEKLEFCKNLIL